MRNDNMITYFGHALFTLIILTILLLSLTASGKINIEYGQEEKVKQLENKIAELKAENEAFTCPEVKCKESPATWVWLVLAGIFYVVGLFFYLDTQKKNKEANELLAKARKEAKK